MSRRQVSWSVLVPVCVVVLLNMTYSRAQQPARSDPARDAVSELLLRDEKLTEKYGPDHPERRIIWERIVALAPTFDRDKALTSTAHDVISMDERELRILVSHLTREIQSLQNRVETLEKVPEYRIKLLR